jgi:hypothetical protein
MWWFKEIIVREIYRCVRKNKVRCKILTDVLFKIGVLWEV